MKPLKNVAASVHQRLLNIAKKLLYAGRQIFYGISVHSAAKWRKSENYEHKRKALTKYFGRLGKEMVRANQLFVSEAQQLASVSER